MLTFGLAMFLVGLPAAGGAHLLVSPGNHRDKRAGAVLVAYSAALAGAFALLMPEGKLISRAVWMEMPGALVAGVVIGAFTGWRRRRKGRDE